MRPTPRATVARRLARSSNLLASVEELSEKQYEKELLRLQTELVYMQEWIVAEGRGAALAMA